MIFEKQAGSQAADSDKKRIRHVLLLLILAIYTSLTVSYALFTPPWEAPDEPAHYLYIKQLAERWRPALDTGIRQTDSFVRDYPYTTSNYEWFQPALGYLPSALAYDLLQLLAPQSLPTEFPPLKAIVEGDNSPPAYIFWQPEPSFPAIWEGNWGLLLMRISSALMGWVVICCAYIIGDMLDPHRGALGLTAAAWIAFLPQFTFINASVRSDTVANALAALLILLAVYLQKKTKRQELIALGLGVLLGLGLLAKYTFIYMLPVASLAVLLAPSFEMRARMRLFLFLFLPALLFTAFYYGLSDSALAALSYTTGTTLKILPEALTWGYLKRIPEPLFVNLFYAAFGWANVSPHPTWVKFAFGLWSAGALFSAYQFLTRWHAGERNFTRKALWILIAGYTFAFLGVLRFNLSAFQPQGRLLFPSLVAWGILGSWGISRIENKRLRITVSAAIVAFMLFFNVTALTLTLFPAYYP